MPVRFRANTSGLQRRIAASKRGRRQAAREATRQLGVAIARAAYERAPNDTGRVQRAVTQAGNDLGAGLVAPPLRESQLSQLTRDKVVDQLIVAEKEVERWERNLASYDRRGQRRSTRSYRQAQRYLRAWTKNRDRAAEYLAELDAAPEGAAIAFGLFGDQRKTKSRNPARLSALTRIVGRTFGGAGRVYPIGPKFFTEIHNKEPHASLVERRHRVMRRALNVARRSFTDARGAGRTYLQRTRAAWKAAA